jgi:hypothetical protein
MNRIFMYSSSTTSLQISESNLLFPLVARASIPRGWTPSGSRFAVHILSAPPALQRAGSSAYPPQRRFSHRDGAGKYLLHFELVDRLPVLQGYKTL